MKGQTLGLWVQDRIAAYPSSGGNNIKLAQPAVSIESVEQHYFAHADEVDYTDGISMTFANWRFNLSSSNTEPMVRLNVESRADVMLMQEKTDEVLSLLVAKS